MKNNCEHGIKTTDCRPCHLKALAQMDKKHNDRINRLEQKFG